MFIHRLPSSLICSRWSLIVCTYFGSPYGARPMILYSPELTLKPVKYVNAEYSRPRECGNRSSRSISISLPRPAPTDDVAHSPTPFIGRNPACSNGGG